MCMYLVVVGVALLLAAKHASGQIQEEGLTTVELSPQTEIVERIVEVPEGQIVSIEELENGNATEFVIVEAFEEPQEDLQINGASIPVTSDLLLVRDFNEEFNRFFGRFQNAVILDDGDNRVRVQATTSPPWRYIGKVGNWCAGTLIGPRHVLTAAHCVWDSTNRRLWSDLAFTPGANGQQKPYGTYAWQTALLPDEFKFGVNRAFDYAVVILRQRPGDSLGKMGIGEECSSRQYYTLNIGGYPHDKFPLDTLWVTSCQGVRLQCSRRMFDHRCDTFGGMSGSPMFVYRPSGNTQFSIRGIHTNAVKSGSLVYNQGITITPQVMAKINGWLSQYP